MVFWQVKECLHPQVNERRHQQFLVNPREVKFSFTAVDALPLSVWTVEPPAGSCGGKQGYDGEELILEEGKSKEGPQIDYFLI